MTARERACGDAKFALGLIADSTPDQLATLLLCDLAGIEVGRTDLLDAFQRGLEYLRFLPLPILIVQKGLA